MGRTKRTKAWMDEIKHGIKKIREMRRDRGMTPQIIIEHIVRILEMQFVTDVGQHQMWATQYQK